MACCENSYNNLPCCCQLVTTTTTAFICEDGTVCNELYSTDCVIYEGQSIELDCLTINPGETYTQILEDIIANLAPCTTTTTTSTTTSTTTTTTTLAPFLPNSIESLWAWYMGDTDVTGGNQVTSWIDQTGNGNDLFVVSTNYPEQVTDTVGTLSTQVVKKATGVNAYLQTNTSVPSITSTGVTVFMVAKTNTQSSVAGYMLKNSQFDCYVESNGNMGVRIGLNSTTWLTAHFANDNYTTVRLYGSGINQEVAFNGITMNSSTGVLYNYVASRLILFTQSGSFGIDQGDNSYAEVLVYTRALLPSEITDVETYLRNKYNHY